jgi:hypothetical protein
MPDGVRVRATPSQCGWQFAERKRPIEDVLGQHFVTTGQRHGILAA